MGELLEKTKVLIKTQVDKRGLSGIGSYFEYCSRFYPFTNEDINSYLEKIDVSHYDTALSVLASGDHAFNLIANGVKRVDTFDVNGLTEYYALGIKRAAIAKYNYKKFLDVIGKLMSRNTSSEEATELIKDLFPYMEEKHKLFWRELLDYNHKIQKIEGISINPISMISYPNGGIGIKSHNSYLSSAASYNEFKKKLERSDLSFAVCDAKCLKLKFKDKYDCLLLSNILDYFHHFWGAGWEPTKLNGYIQYLESMMNPEGIIFLHYLFQNYTSGSSSKLFTGTSITASALSDNLEVVPLNPTVNSAIVLQRIPKEK